MIRPCLSVSALIVVAIATAACSRQGTDNTAASAANSGPGMTIDLGSGAAPSAAITADASQMRPGRWEGTMRIKVKAGPAIAPIDQSQPLTSCITPDQLRPGTNPFAAGLGSNCRYDQFRMGGGKVEGSMSCAGSDTRSDMTGEYTPDTFRMRATGISSGDNTVAESEMLLDMRRTGECRGDERKQ